MQRVKAELIAKPGDQRRALLPLLSHSSVQVKQMAANTLLAIAPIPARTALEEVKALGIQCADAWGMIDALDNGSFIPS